MKVDVQPLENHQVKLLVDVDAAEFEKARQQAARQLSKRVKIPGFRPGKAPYAMVVRFLGEEAIQEEAIEILADTIYPKALDEAKISPYGPGRLVDYSIGETPRMEFVVDLQPEVELGDFHSIRLPYELEPIQEDEVDEVIQNLRDNQAIIENVERPAQEGDLVVIKLSAVRLGEKEEVLSMPQEALTFEIEGEDEIDKKEWPFPGFSRALLGHAAGETYTLRYAYPEDAFYSTLKGSEVEFTIEIKEVKSRTLPQLDDEFARSIGDYSTLEDLRAELRKLLEQQAEQEYNVDYEDQVLDKIIEGSVIRIPPTLLSQEINTVIEELEERLAKQNLDLETYLKAEGKDLAALREDVRPVAEKRLKRALVMREIVKALNIEVNEGELQHETGRTLESLSRLMPQKEFRKLLSGDRVRDIVDDIALDLVLRRARERIRNIARGIEQVQSQASVSKGLEENVEAASMTLEEPETQAASLESRNKPDESQSA